MTAKRRAAGPASALSPVELQILLSLADEDRHGYGIKLEVESRTGGDYTLGPGTLYEAIHRLQRACRIEQGDGEAGSQPRGRGAPRKYYRLTELGRREMERELSRLAEIVRYARARDLLPESPAP